MPPYAVNKHARFDYEILDTLEGGLVLTGAEVKSIRGGHVKLNGSYLVFHNNEPFLIGTHVSRYPQAGPQPEYNPERTRKVLLSKAQIAYLRGKTEENGLTIVPLSLYTKGPFVKIELGVARGKKTHDKRATIKKRETEREVRRVMKRGRADE